MSRKPIAKVSSNVCVAKALNHANFPLPPGKKLPPDVEIDGVFATNELDLREVEVYGFDYDYTLACYKESVDHLIYNLGRETLVHKFKVNTIENSFSLVE